ncbi:tyrosine-type recombinase/integrase [Microlunatus ginsengisoli]|uniref:Tyrosine-type recombinase/integrase n=1 Tax=Microlunatus ginsengisoli TaxID=363863 RepID=A0ABP7A0P4_9ACTN
MTTVLEAGSAALDYQPAPNGEPDESSADPAASSVPYRFGNTTITQIVKRVGSTGDTQVVDAAIQLLDALLVREGETWAERWLDLERTTVSESMDEWRRQVGSTVRPTHLSKAFVELAALDVIRPSYEWMHRRGLRGIDTIAACRSQEDAAAFKERLRLRQLRIASQTEVQVTLGKLCAHTGRRPRDITLPDIEAYWEVLKPRKNDIIGPRTTWQLMVELKWLEAAPTPPRFIPTRRVRQCTPEELVDKHNIAEPMRDMFVQYLKQRAARMDYASLNNLALRLIKTFWVDIVKHNPDQASLELTREQIDSWRQRFNTKINGRPRSDMEKLQTLMIVRGFYLDIAQWAHIEPYWAQWAAASPITRAEVGGFRKARVKQIAVQQQKTRDLASLLPRFVKGAEDQLTEVTALLERVREVGPGGRIDINRETWTVHKASPQSLLLLQNGAHHRRIEREESRKFWTWACLETLRHSGIRIEEMLELTHLSFQRYVMKPTGETVPLVHIKPSKTDRERMIVASPELVHVFAEILKRARRPDGTVPLVQRWDPYEHLYGEPLPHLFVDRALRNPGVISHATISAGFIRLARDLDLRIAGQPVHFVPHDLRRLFATEALSSGLPPHIVQVLMGHQSLATTQGYAAIYPADVIRHHRMLITTRRQQRPTDEYREPTPQEWAEFEAHFVQRKLSLGTCGRAYGTDCHHEHACLRCALLRPDPDQINRLRTIIDNLNDRIDEATSAGWIGEVDGLKVSLAGAQQKLQQMEKQITRSETFLGMPDLTAPTPPTGSGEIRSRTCESE